MTVLLCLTTCPERESAMGIARALVDERLAACASLLPGVTSFYRWRGAVEQADEWQLFIKTTQARLAAMTSRLAELHPYDVPELIVLEAGSGLPSYLEWVRACVESEATEAT